MKAKLAKLGHALLAAVTAKAVVQLEKKLAVQIALKVAVSFGAGAGVLELIQKLG